MSKKLYHPHLVGIVVEVENEEAWRNTGWRVTDPKLPESESPDAGGALGDAGPAVVTNTGAAEQVKPDPKK